jgi:thiol:disulfide interchange protein DsbD
MFITAIWLGWVAYSQISNSGLNHNQVFVDKWQQEWLPYSPELINQIKSEKQVAYIDFTASWCITCQVNKSVVFSNKEVRDYIALNKIKLVRADWTNKDTNIGLALKGFNRASVPLNIIYRKNSDYITLPTILTASTVLEALTLANKQNP